MVAALAIGGQQQTELTGQGPTAHQLQGCGNGANSRIRLVETADHNGQLGLVKQGQQPGMLLQLHLQSQLGRPMFKLVDLLN